MGSGFNVTTEQLRTHANSLEGIAESVDTAAEAAAEKRMGGMIYGVLFDGIILDLLNTWADHLHGSLTKEGDLGRSISDGVKTNADIYDMAEDGNKKIITKSGEH